MYNSLSFFLCWNWDYIINIIIIIIIIISFWIYDFLIKKFNFFLFYNVALMSVTNING